MISLSSPNLGALDPSANLTTTSKVTDGVAIAASVPKGTDKIPGREAETLCSAKYLRNKPRSGAPQRAKSEVTMTSLSKFLALSSRLAAELHV